MPDEITSDNQAQVASDPVAAPEPISEPAMESEPADPESATPVESAKEPAAENAAVPDAPAESVESLISAEPEENAVPQNDIVTENIPPVVTGVPLQTETEKTAEDPANPAAAENIKSAELINEPPSAAPAAEVERKPIKTETYAPTVPAACPTFKEQWREYIRGLRPLAVRKRREIREANLEKIIAFAREKGKVTNDDVERLAGVKDTQAAVYLNMLVKKNRLVRFGAKRNIFYKAVN